ncbi:NUDIX domain-containing protein [Microbacterium timonense]|uniref:NUDIX domain-containing protein n=1 Tax=Microbacterium timonense TaxID=2086576 RepID=UPI000D0F2546|nr:NUDIX hydrolase [Microbacterium timonense]
MLPTHQLAAAVLVRNVRGDLLMVASPYRTDLVLPGGIVEEDEPPAVAAAREVHEETGLLVSPTRLLVVEHLTRTSTGGSGLRFVFDTAPVPVDVSLVKQEGEVAELLWLPPDQAVQRHVPRGRNRLQAALAALSDGKTTYLDGHFDARW